MNEVQDQRLVECQQALEGFKSIRLRPGGNLVEISAAYVETMSVLDRNQTAGIRVVEHMKDQVDKHFREEVVRVCRVEQFLHEYRPEYPVEEPEYILAIEA